MKEFASINENDLDGVLNAIFLNTYSEKEDESVARFVLEEDYAMVIDETKERELLVRLSGENKLRTWIILILALIALLVFLFLFLSEKESSAGQSPQKTSALLNTITQPDEQITHTVLAKDPETGEEKVIEIRSKDTSHAITAGMDGQQNSFISDTAKQAVQNDLPPRLDTVKEKELPYFDEVGLAYFQGVKDQMLLKILKLDNNLYTRIEPGSTTYKGQEMVVHPFVMSSFPVTNLQYKVFLSDLFRDGKMDEMKKCLPKQEVWKEYNCNILAKNYFDNESYNDFPVVNVTKEAMMIFCKWLEKEINAKLNGPAKKIKSKGGTPKKEILVSLPYDYQWIYAADAYYALIPDCGGYNTIYDVSEGLVDKDFFKRTSQVNKWDQKKMTWMDKLNDVNRFGMNETEMMNIFREAMAFKEKKISGLETPAYPGKMENCCLAGHVGELILLKDGGTMVRGCCWKNKAEYEEMTSVYKKYGASPFVGFRVAFIVKNTTNKDPFW